MEGLKMSPFKVGENYQLKRDLVTFLQNSVREPKLQYEDMKAKLQTTLRIKQRVRGGDRRVRRRCVHRHPPKDS